MTAHPSRTEIVTFGCRLNAYESEVMKDLAAKSGQGAGQTGETIVFNTCAVTSEAERQARQAIRKARRENPSARIVVTGCAAQIDPARWSAMPEVDRVLGNAEKLKPESWGAQADEARVQVNDIMAVRETAGHLIEGFDGRARAFVQVQQGCDHRCTFCIIPYGRGPSRSVPAGEIVEQVRRLAANGYAEIVLTGVDITSWGADLPGRPTLGQLTRRLLKLVPELKRLRISSIDVSEIDADLWIALEQEERLMPHLHLSLQHGADLILKRMKRRHSRAQAIEACDRARLIRPGIVFGADLIAGFPTEEEGHFAELLSIVEACGLTFLHVFPYSPRPGTPAARMPQLPGPVIRERARLLRAAGDAALGRFLDQRLGTSAQVLVEQDGLGRSEHFAPVAIDGAPGELVSAFLAERVGERLIGHRITGQRAA